MARTGSSCRPGCRPRPVSWVVVQKQAHDVVLSTYGRGLYIMEDITPLEQGVMETAATPTPDVRLVAPRPAYRIVRGQARALFSYVLKAAPQGPGAVRDSGFQGRAGAQAAERHRRAPGLNRTSWDLRYEAPPLVALRTTPPENPHIWEEPRFQGQETRAITHWGLAQAEVGPDRRARTVHREDDGGRPELHAAADHSAHARQPRRRRRAAIQRAPAAQGARRYHRGQQHDQSAGMDAPPVGGSVEDARRQSRTCSS